MSGVGSVTTTSRPKITAGRSDAIAQLVATAAGLRAAERVGSVGKAVAARELGDPPNGPVVVLADQHQCAVARVELPPPPRGEHRDDDVRHLGDLGHQPQHLRRAAPRSRWCRATARMGIDQLPPFRNAISPMNCVGPSVDGQVALTGERVHHLDLARLDIDEAIGRFAGAGEERPGRVVPLDARRPAARRCAMPRGGRAASRSGPGRSFPCRRLPRALVRRSIDHAAPPDKVPGRQDARARSTHDPACPVSGVSRMVGARPRSRGEHLGEVGDQHRHAGRAATRPAA